MVLTPAASHHLHGLDRRGLSTPPWPVPSLRSIRTRCFANNPEACCQEEEEKHRPAPSQLVQVPGLRFSVASLKHPTSGPPRGNAQEASQSNGTSIPQCNAPRHGTVSHCRCGAPAMPRPSHPCKRHATGWSVSDVDGASAICAGPSPRRSTGIGRSTKEKIATIKKRTLAGGRGPCETGAASAQPPRLRGHASSQQVGPRRRRVQKGEGREKLRPWLWMDG